MDLSKWKSQLRKGAAELVVLTILERQERYGLEILQRISDLGALEMSDGTLYPLLNRLKRDGKIDSRWVEDEGASHPRKYYQLTEEGQHILAGMKEEWKHFSGGLNRLLAEEVSK